MSTGTDAGPPEPEGLQFDQAEFDQATGPTVACAACKREIVDYYFEINGTIVCEPCNQLIGQRLRSGSGFVRFLRAVAFGSVAAAVAAAAYAAFIHTTHFDLSLIAIFVGYLIGRAVRAGSLNRGGLIYQLLAVLLTYLAVGVTYTSVVFLEGQLAANPNMPSDFLSLAVAFVVMSIVMPVMFARESVITIAIVGFALWQAWKMNVRAKLVVTGPYRVGDAGTEEPTEGTPAHA